MWISFRLAAQDAMLSPLHTKCFTRSQTQTRQSIHRTLMLRDVVGVKPLGSPLSSAALFPEGKRWPTHTHTQPFHCASLWSKLRNATGIFWQARWPHKLYAVFTMCQDGKGYICETELSQRPIIHTDSRMKKHIKTLQLWASLIKTLNHVITDFESR